MNLKTHQEDCLDYWKNGWYKTKKALDNALQQIDIVKMGRDIANEGLEIATNDLKENTAIYESKMIHTKKVTNYEDIITASFESKLENLRYV